jgi:hypothetical protein
MISFVIARRTNRDFENMFKMWHWLEDKFGKADWYKTWDGDFAYHNTDKFVRFQFWDEKIATWFALEFGEYILVDDEWELTKDLV